MILFSHYFVTDNGRLCSAELLLRDNGTVVLIRRAEAVDDYFTTLDFDALF
jgi:diaminopimelate decarboxylase